MFPYKEGCEIFDEWKADEENPIREEYPLFVRCEICGEEIRLDDFCEEELWEDGWRSYSDIYHADCIREKITLDRAFRFLDEDGYIKDFFNWFYREDENPIAVLPFALKMALIEQYYEEKDAEYYMAQYVEQYLEDFIGWMKRKNEI